MAAPELRAWRDRVLLVHQIVGAADGIPWEALPVLILAALGMSASHLAHRAGHAGADNNRAAAADDENTDD